MAADLGKLNVEFRAKVERLVSNCRDRGVEMRPYDGLRDPWGQARLWRQSRSTEEINLKITELEENGAPLLAHYIRSVGPQHGGHVTNTPPGVSWHQWGEALDCFWIVGGKAEWSTKRLINGVNGYAIFAQEAEKIGLDAGGYWKSFKDWPHVQFRKQSNAKSVMTWPEINQEMERRFPSG